MSEKRIIFNQTIKYRFPTHTNLLLMGREDAAASEVYLVDYEPGESTQLHRHEDVEQLFYVLEGEGFLQLGEGPDEEYRIKPGDLIRTPVGTPHKVMNDGKSVLRYLCIDCFVSSKEERDASWDEYVRKYCAAEGWDFEQVKAG